jgi:ADP-ribose pyrophosphatase YjhB (NUDIX family)
MQVSYCNNCDKTGHTFHSCRKPIVSYGIIVFRRNKINNEIEYLTVCRKHSFGYIDFMRGRYSVNNRIKIKDIIYEMTNKEKKDILEKSFMELWKDLWGSSRNSYYINEKTFAQEKYNMLYNGIMVNNDFYNTKILVNECDSSWDMPEWGFPKGRKNYKEPVRDCAIREWCEETGFSVNNLDIIDNIEMLHEIVIGSNYQTYKDSYYIAKYVDQPENDSDTIYYQKLEISNAQWLPYDKLMGNMRHYHLERINIIKKVDSLLNKSTQYIYG